MVEAIEHRGEVDKGAHQVVGVAVHDHVALAANLAKQTDRTLTDIGMTSRDR